MKRMLLAAAAALAVLSTAPSGYAYVADAWWNSNSLTVRAASGTYPSGSATRTALSTVLSRWNSNPSQFNFSVSWGDSSVSTSNSQSETWAQDEGTNDPPAECVQQVYSSGRLYSADVIFYNRSDFTWSTSTTASTLWEYGGSRRSYHTTAIHEFGHALGLDHEDDEYNAMGEDWTHIHVNNGVSRCYPGEDASDGAVSIYGTDSSAGQDVSVSHWKWSGRDDGYSEHTKTKIYDASGVELGYVSEDGGDTRRYQVYPGQVVQVEFTFENNGRSTQSSVAVGYYVSSNDNISTGDTRVDTRTLGLGRNDVYTIKNTLTIPSSLTVGNDYYVGAIADYSGGISEFDESNNAAYIPIEVVSP
ncbi:MAG: matrixin family metalloprotease [Planctomycetes bacterium]|nr:matrixin family metalloprotease [Planctomycetota bacterium]